MGRNCKWRAKESFIVSCRNQERQRFYEDLDRKWLNDPRPLAALAAMLHNPERKVARAAARMIHFASDRYISTGLSTANPKHATFADDKTARRLLGALAAADTVTATDIVRSVVFVGTARGLIEETFEVLDGRSDAGDWPKRMGYKASLRFGGSKVIPQLDAMIKRGTKHDIQHALSATSEVKEFAEGDRDKLCEWVHGHVRNPIGQVGAGTFIADQCDEKMLGELVDRAEADLENGHITQPWMDIMGRVAGRGAPHDKRAFAMLEKSIVDTELKYRQRLSALDSLRRHVTDERTRAICKKIEADKDPAVKDSAVTCLRQYAEAAARAAASGSASASSPAPAASGTPR
jgi:hypothetical protein